MQPNNIRLIKKPWISEKGTDLAAFGKYVFLVEPKAAKPEIKKALEDYYKVSIVNINTVKVSYAGKNYKKAIVTLKEGQKIDIVPH